VSSSCFITPQYLLLSFFYYLAEKIIGFLKKWKVKGTKVQKIEKSKINTDTKVTATI
jgi:hypothetical protein